MEGPDSHREGGGYGMGAVQHGLVEHGWSRQQKKARKDLPTVMPRIFTEAQGNLSDLKP
jgi:hypothetical protein